MRQDFDGLLDKLHYDGTRQYSQVKGEVAYLDGKALGRSLDIPRPQMLFLGLVLIVAIVIAFMMVSDLVIEPLSVSRDQEATVNTNISREPSISSIPIMSELINVTDESIQEKFQSEGLEYYDASALADSGNMLLIHVPSDMSVEEVGSLYLSGISSLSASDATRLLCGAWVLSVDRVNTTSMVVRYADFSTGDPDEAVQNALKAEGLSSATVTGSGVDDAENTYISGTIDIDGESCTWKISALELDEMYSISGLPEKACYVGIRITK